MSWWRLFYHVVWATKAREPLIDDARVDLIERAIRASCHEAGIVVHAIGMMPDHVHVAVSIPPRLAIAAAVGQLKGTSSHLLNHAASLPDAGSFFWQAEYGVLSFGERSLDAIVDYVTNQRSHHSSDDLWPSFELTERPYPTGTDGTRPPVLSPGGASSVQPGVSTPGFHGDRK